MMGNNDGVVRAAAGSVVRTISNHRLKTSLLKGAMYEAFGFYSRFFGMINHSLDFDKLAVEYEKELSHARSLQLFMPGGICEKAHLNLWCLGRVFAPEIYIESGVFIGSSLHAFINSPELKKVIAIDPNLRKLKIPKNDIPGAVLVNDKDFSELELSGMVAKTLVYFDDHINSASRIIQASKKGIKFLLFDDSTGFEGICQRLYPSIPTVPMIMNYELLKPNDQLSWTFRPTSSGSKLKQIIKQIILRKKIHNNIRVSLHITDELIEECRQAQSLIKKWKKIPDLGKYIPQLYPEKMIDTSKYLIELN